MPIVVTNPYSAIPEQAAVWDKGYEEAYAAPDEDHADPYDGELLDVYEKGVEQGRNDRRSEWSEFTPLPAATAEGFTRFESAPDGTLIPIPDEIKGKEIRSDAKISVNARTASGYYVAILNIDRAALDYEEQDHTFSEVFTEAILKGIEASIAHGLTEGVAVAFEVGGSVFGIVLGLVLFPTPTAQETVLRSFLPDRTGVTYVVISEP